MIGLWKHKIWLDYDLVYVKDDKTILCIVANFWCKHTLSFMELNIGSQRRNKKDHFPLKKDQSYFLQPLWYCNSAQPPYMPHTTTLKPKSTWPPIAIFSLTIFLIQLIKRLDWCVELDVRTIGAHILVPTPTRESIHWCEQVLVYAMRALSGDRYFYGP